MEQNNKKFRTILAIDSSTGTCSASIWKNNEISAYCEELSASLQSKKLVVMVEDVLNKSNIAYNDLDLVACSVGPGSFTGIRIGLATARGIGFAAGIPVLGFNSLEIMAFGMRGSKPTLAVLNAGKGEFIHQYFDKSMVGIAPPILSPSHPANEVMKVTYPRADLLAELAATYPTHGVEPLPFYVRPPDAKLPEKKNAAN